MVLAIINTSLVAIGSLVIAIWIILKLSDRPIMTMILFLISLLTGILLLYPEIHKII